jgi:DNA-directed RNA polymerase specialized sigma24 family protein
MRFVNGTEFTAGLADAAEFGALAERYRRESIELVFLTAIQLLSPRQRAVPLLCDVLDWSAAEVAAWLETSVASINSAPTDDQRVLPREPCR